MSAMSNLILDIQFDIEEGKLTFAEIASKYEVPVSWVVEAFEMMVLPE